MRLYAEAEISGDGGGGCPAPLPRSGGNASGHSSHAPAFPALAVSVAILAITEGIAGRFVDGRLALAQGRAWWLEIGRAHV